MGRNPMNRPLTPLKVAGIAALVIAGLLWAFGRDRDTATVILVFGVVFTFVIIAAMRQKSPPPPAPEIPPLLSNNFGEASYCPEITLLTPDFANAPWRGVFFGKSSSPVYATGNGIPVCSKPERHVMITGSTRTGKGVRVLQPTLLRYG